MFSGLREKKQFVKCIHVKTVKNNFQDYVEI